ncbi:MAG: hypothetical protein P8016_11050 [Sedimentisphaerales bacterium]
MKRISLPSLAFIFVAFFCRTTVLCQTITLADEPNEPGNVTSENTVDTPDSNEFETPETFEGAEPVFQTKKASDYDLALQRHSIEIGPEMYSFTYKESGVKDKGVFYGGVLNYTYRWWVPPSANEPLLPGSVAFRAEFRYATGNADYDGALSDGTPYKIDDIDYDTFETRLMLGVDELNIDWLASISTGVGYRYLTDDSSFDPYGYRRESNYIYIPVAYQLDGKFENNWAWGTKLEVDILAWGLQKSYLSDIGESDIENRQRSGYGLRGSLRLQNRTKMGVLIIEPFIRYWNIDQSDFEYVSPSYYYEPKNNTTELGVQLLWRF